MYGGRCDLAVLQPVPSFLALYFLMNYCDIFIVFLRFWLIILGQVCQILHYLGSLLCIYLLYPVDCEFGGLIFRFFACLYGLFKRLLVCWHPLVHYLPSFTLFACMSHSSEPSPQSQHGVTDHPHQDSTVCDLVPLSTSNSMVGSGSDHQCQPTVLPRTSYAKATAFGLGCSDNPSHSTPSSSANPPLPTTKISPSSPVAQNLPISSNPEVSILPKSPTNITQNMDELNALCLLGQIWGDHIPLSAIISKTKNDWKFLKGQVDYVDLGNHWILIRFANVSDKERVWCERPWFVGSFNLVLTEWIPFFDPFSASISHIDQWVRIPRLPWEFWDLNTLTELLLPVGQVIRVDQNTLLRLKGKFARVCVHVDITEPLPGSLVVAFEGRSMTIPLIYEGLHEVCALCGHEDHQIESCALLPSQSTKEVRIEKFGTPTVKVLKHPATALTSSKSTLSATEKWIRVSPKKRMRSQVKPPRAHVPTAPGPQLVINKSSPPLSPVYEHHLPPADSSEQGLRPNILPRQSPLPTPAPLPLDPSDSQQGVGEDDMVTSPSPRAVSSPSGIDPDEEFADTFLNIEPFQDIEMSTDSTKRKREEEGEECLSKLQN